MNAWNISATAIRNPIMPVVLFVALLFAGLTAYFRLPINQLPNLEFPAFTVNVALPGAAPVELETQVTQKIEAALTGVEGIKRMESFIGPGGTTTSITLEMGANLSRAIEDARDAVARIRSDLPADVSEPVIARLDAAAEPIAYYAVKASGKTPAELSWFVDNELTRELLAVPGMSQVQRMGGVEREIRVELDPQRLKALGVTADDISRQLRQQNVDLPGGRAEVGGQAQSIRTLAGAETVETLSAKRILLSDGRTVRLDDLGTVTDSSSELASISRFNEEPSISFLMQKTKGASDVDVYDAAVAKLREIEKATPGVTFVELGTPVHFIRGMYKSSIAALIEGALFAVIVVFLFLRDWRSTVVAAFAIPLSIIPTFLGMEVMGFTLNMITLIALGLVAGVLVDDAIVEIENIVRHIRMGKDPYKAALEAADEIGLAVVATSATIIAVFLPVSFMTGINGQFFREFGLTVAIATFFSLLVARLITPLMAAFFLKGHAIKEAKKGPIIAIYEDALRFSIRRPWAVFAMGIAIFVGSLWLASKVPATFIPRLDNGSIQVKVEFPPGMKLIDADAIMRRMSAEIRQQPDIAQVFSNVSGNDGGAGTGSLYVELTPREERDRAAYDIQQSLRPFLQQFPDVRASFQNFQGGGRGADISLEFVGEDPAAVSAAADALVAEMKKIPELADVTSSAALKRPEIQIRPRSEEAARLGVTAADLASAVRIATSGDVDQNLAKFTTGDRQIPIRVLLRPDNRLDLDTIKALEVRSSFGAPVRLDAVADVTFGIGEANLNRRDRQRSVSVTANLISGQITDLQRQVEALPAAKSPPEGVFLKRSGDSEENAELAPQFMNAFLWGVLLIYFVLVLLFRDFFQPITILFAIPLSIGGAFAGLLLANQPLSLFVFIGLLMLAGIVTKNSILLVDFAVEQMHKGMSRNQALFEAGIKRARPIIMTTLAMSAGMIPAAIGSGVDGTLRQGMGVAVIGGLMLSTLLSLLFVPAMFVLIDRLERFVSPLFGRLATKDALAGRAEDLASRKAAE
jgi:HAE1 family hydrophobic/amphiphilic exporter-1